LTISKIKFQKFWNFILGTPKTRGVLIISKIKFQKFWNFILGNLQNTRGFDNFKNKVPKHLELYFGNIQNTGFCSFRRLQGFQRIRFLFEPNLGLVWVWVWDFGVLALVLGEENCKI